MLRSTTQTTKMKAVKFPEVSTEFSLTSSKIYRSQNENVSAAVKKY